MRPPPDQFDYVMWQAPRGLWGALLKAATWLGRTCRRQQGVE